MPENEFFAGSPLTLLRVVDSGDFESENLLAFDVGYRTRLAEKVSVDLAIFYNLYDDLRTNELGTPFTETAADSIRQIFPLVVDNKLHGSTRGVEVATSWQLRGAYTYLCMDMKLDDGGRYPLATTWDEENPNHWVSRRSVMDLPHRLSLDLHLRYMDDLPILEIDRYTTLDARLGWRAAEQVDIFVVGQHLLSSPHLEFTRQNVVNLTGGMRAGVYSGLAFHF